MAIYFEERGSKQAPTIVFIHGGGVSGWMWSKQTEYFKDHHCLIPDLPEHGKSINEGDISISDSTRRIADLIEAHANGGKADVVGHSLGAKITVELLSTRPELVKHAVVASALFRPIPYLKLTHRHFIYNLSAFMMKSEWYANLTAKQFKFPDKESENHCLREFKGLTGDSLYRIYDELYQNLSLPQGLEKADVPTLAVAGEKEPKAMRQSVVDITRALPDSKGILIKGGLHNYPWARYECFNKIVEAWISSEQIADESVIHL